MYTEIGGGKFVRHKNILGIFDTDKTTIMKSTRDYLGSAEKSGKVEVLTSDIPKSFVVETTPDGFTVNLSPLNTSTIEKRCRQKELSNKE